jgi:hypothetical protein
MVDDITLHKHNSKSYRNNLQNKKEKKKKAGLICIQTTLIKEDIRKIKK